MDKLQLTKPSSVLTTEPITTGKHSIYPMEWGRTIDVQRIFGIKRGTLYNLFADGEIDGKELRVRGKIKGVRIWNMDSIRKFIDSSPSNVDNDNEQKNSRLN